MEIIALKDDNTHYSIPVSFQETSPIKLFDYGVNHVIFVTQNNQVFELDLNKSDDEFIKLESLPFVTVKHLVCCNFFTIIVNDNNEIFVKGLFCGETFKTFSSLTLENNNNLLMNEKITKIRAGDDCFLILTENNSLFGYSGENSSGQLGLKDFTTKKLQKIDTNNLQIKDIQRSDNHSILLDKFGNIYTTGSNNMGQLGLGDFEDRFNFTKVDLPFKVIKIHADNLSSFIVNENFELFCCGYNKEGELGVGTINNLNLFTKINKNFNNTKVYGFSFTYLLSSFITDENSNIFISGGSFESLVRFGVNKINNNNHNNDDGDEECLTEFTMVDIIGGCCGLRKRRFVYIIPMTSPTIFIVSDYKMNDEDEESILEIKALEKQLVDINIVCEE